MDPTRCKYALSVVVQPDGAVYPCICADWPKISLGNVYESGLLEIYDGAAARRFREEVHSGRYGLCRTGVCLRQEDAETYRLLEAASAVGYRVDHPTYYALNYDPSCNLVCASCRPSAWTISAEQRRRLLRLQEELLAAGAFAKATVHLTQEGDPFASHVYRGLLAGLTPERAPGVDLVLQTNGLALTRKTLRSLDHVLPALRTLSISMDAATEATYAVVRGGDFSRLLDNLALVHEELVRPGRVALILNFVVQAANFREIPEFLELAARLDASCFFAQLGNKCMSPEVYRRHAVCRWSHPLFPEFVRVVRQPRVQQATRVAWTDLSAVVHPEREPGTLRSLAKRALTAMALARAGLLKGAGPGGQGAVKRPP